MAPSTFLFCDPVHPERIRWFAAIFGASKGTGQSGDPARARIFLTGDALFSLVDSRVRPTWNSLSVLPSVQVIADGDELRLQGLHGPVSSGCPHVLVPGAGEGASFWDLLVAALRQDCAGTKSVAFLLCNSPYMSRVPVYMLRFLSRVKEAGLHPELYTYLDGVHTLHDGQRPSEFENIGRGVSALAGAAAREGRDPWFAACSRCATARGYYQMNAGTGFCEPASCIQEIEIRPLKEILARFSKDHPILSHAGGGTVHGEGTGGGTPHLAVFITNTPYYTEWAFGGLSLAIAAAVGGIRTTVIFIEDGVYALHGAHEVLGNDKIFNIQEMIAVTTDVEGLRYVVHTPSLAERGIGTSGDLSFVDGITDDELARLLSYPDQGGTGSAIRMIFF